MPLETELRGYRTLMAVMANQNGGSLVFHDNDLQAIGPLIESIGLHRNEAEKTLTFTITRKPQ
jgi:hypothetical protein